jgi:ketosteroid isomerase-like protein
MSQSNVETVRSIYQRWSEGDFGASVDLLDPHVVVVLRPQFPDAGTYTACANSRSRPAA